MPPPALPASLRLFLALWPDDAVRASIAGWQRSWAWPPGSRLVAPEQLHLTLHFIGNVPAARLAEVVRGLQVPFDAHDIEFGDAKVWPGGIAILRPLATPEPLAGLHGRLAMALRALQLPVEERPFRPHVTLARKASDAAPPPGPAIRWRADSGYVLVRTLPSGGGYRIVERFSPR